MTLEQIAKIAHEVSRVWYRYNGDTKQPSWDEIPDQQKQSMMDGVRFILNNPDVGPELQHDRWLESKKAEGWSYGPEVDVLQKEHPCFVPFSDLSREQQFKDVLFGTVVRACLIK